ncbi:sigma-54 interaction domain-containing protein [Desulfitibacter alkalitolerans]|uniref:sigma-54 interaction domain-containing protein n=1 Tax=Desulfitibacter alkalitolerans TaxID=264641 RepID=UPI0004886659|nr:sigma 54-interacting transcriptional regulator [Desulfitibacter alkalitolerans]
MKKTICLICKANDTFQVLYKQLCEFFEPEIGVTGCSLDSGTNEKLVGDIALITSSDPEIYNPAIKIAGNDIEPIVAERQFDPLNIEQLIRIPTGTKVFVINNLPGTCKEVIETLEKANINHLTYIPIYPGYKNEDPEVKIAITLRDILIRPAGVTQYVDVGIRLIHLNTLLSVAKKLGLSEHRINKNIDSFLCRMIELGKRLGEAYVREQKYLAHLKSTLEAIQDPILAFDNTETLIFHNEAAEIVLKSNSSIIQNLESINNQLVSINHRKYIINSHDIHFEGKTCGKLFFMKDITQITDLEKKLKNSLKDTGRLAKYNFKDIIGNNPTIKNTIAQAEKMAKSDYSILISGESGTGKELLAHAIHCSSSRYNGPFVAMNFASIPESLVESELFGYVEGAFTGARKGGKIGLFEQGNGGTVFLDEIGDAPLSIQSRLLRVLQEKEMIRVGDTKVLKVDVRIIAATNHSLPQLVNSGKFRQDLYYRINVLPITLPPLRERRDDIPLLLKTLTQRHNKNINWSKQALDFLTDYHWPGNIRELINVISYVLTICEDNEVQLCHLPPIHTLTNKTNKTQGAAIPNHTGERQLILSAIHKLNKLGKSAGRQSILQMLRYKNLDLSEQQLRYKLKALEREGFIYVGKTKQGSFLTDKGKGDIRSLYLGD